MVNAQQNSIDEVLVIKSKARLYLKSAGQVVKSFPVVFGKSPIGHKKQLGDNKTPEGLYTLDYKNINSDFYKSIHISYPNEQDRRIAKQSGIDPGGNIMIHGQKNGYGWPEIISQNVNWTKGCIALSNSDMDKIWNAVQIGTPIRILP